MKFEFSAGGIVIKREITRKKNNSRDDAKVYVLLCQHSQHHGWVFPKGLIGDSPSTSSGQVETKEQAAIREVKEETGIDGKITRLLTPVTYWYSWEGEKRRKTVYYYLMSCEGGDISQHDDEMENVEWLPLDAVEKRLTYPSDKKVWQEAKSLILASSN